MLRAVSKLPRVSKGMAPLFDIITKEEGSKMLMGYRLESNASAYARVDDNPSNVSGVGDDLMETGEQYPIYKRLSPGKLHINMADLPVNMQGPFADLYFEQLKADITKLGLTKLNFNFVNEEVFRYNLNMPIRRLGFKSTFTRYNHDLGLATFERR